MPKTIAVQDLQQSLRDVIDEVAQDRVEYVLTQDNRPEAVLVPYEEFRRFREFQEKDVLSRFDRLLAHMAAQNAAFSDEEVARDVAAAHDETAG